jgi:hypothetical protein
MTGSTVRPPCRRRSFRQRESLSAYDLYLRALAQFHRFIEEGFAEAVSLTKQALTQLPQFGFEDG